MTQIPISDMRQLASANATKDDSYKIPLIRRNATDGLRVAVTVGATQIEPYLDLDNGNLIVKCASIKKTVGTCPADCSLNTLTHRQFDFGYLCTNISDLSLTVGEYKNANAKSYVLVETGSSYVNPEGVFGIGPMDPDEEPSLLFQESSQIGLSVSKTKSYLVLNDENTVRSGKPFTVPIAEDDSWALEPLAIRFGTNESAWYPCGGQASGIPCRVKISTRQTGLYMESSDYRNFMTTLKDSYGCYDFSNGLECSTRTALPRITVNFGNLSINFDEKDYTTEATDKYNYTYKAITFNASMESNAWVLGTAFLERHFTVLDSTAKAVTFYCTGEECVSETLVAENMPTSAPTTRPPRSSNDDSSGRITKGGVKLALYLGIAGAVVALVIIAVVVKMCCGKDILEDEDEDKKKQDEEEEREAATAPLSPVYVQTATPQRT